MCKSEDLKKGVSGIFGSFSKRRRVENWDKDECLWKDSKWVRLR